MAEPVFVAASAIGASTAGSFSIVLPAHQADDILWVVSWYRASATVATPLNWTQAATALRGTTRYYLHWHRAVNANTADPLFDYTGTNDGYGICGVYRGDRPLGDPYDVLGAFASGTANPATLTGITTLTVDSLVVASIGGEDNTGTGATMTATDPAAFVEHYAESAVGTDGCVALGEGARAAAGATGNVSCNFGATVVGWGGWVAALVPPPAPVAPLVQAKRKIGGGDPEVEAFGTTIVLTLDANVTVGNTLAVWAFYGGPIGDFTSIADNLGNTYTVADMVEPAGGGTDTHCLFTAPITTGGACTITITLAASYGYRSMIVHEVEGRDNSASLVDAVSNNFQSAPGTGTDALTSGAAVTTVDGCYIFGVTSFEETSARPLAAGTNFTKVTDSAGTGTAPGSGSGAFASEHLVQSTAGSIAATFTRSGTVAPSLTMMMALAPAVAGQEIAVGQASETNTAQAVTHLKTLTIGQVVETNVAQAVGRLATKLIAQVTEADAAQALASAKAAAVAQVTETDLAQGLLLPQTVTVEQVTEVNAAQVISRVTTRDVEQVAEVDVSQSLAHSKQRLVGQVTEADVAQGVTRTKSATVAQVLETNLAQAVAWAPRRLVAQVFETNTAFGIAGGEVVAVLSAWLTSARRRGRR
jgi:hypothetical protein